MSEQYTPGLWTLTQSPRGGYSIRSADDKPIADLWHNGGNVERAGELIVRAVNAHADVLAALIAAEIACDEGSLPGERIKARQLIRAALDKVETA